MSVAMSSVVSVISVISVVSRKLVLPPELPPLLPPLLESLLESLPESLESLRSSTVATVVSASAIRCIGRAPLSPALSLCCAEWRRLCNFFRVRRSVAKKSNVPIKMVDGRYLRSGKVVWNGC